MIGNLNNFRLLSIVAAMWIFTLAGCDRMITKPSVQTTRDADASANAGDYLKAVGLYESVLDGSPKAAELHYKLALLYDDKMNDPLDAMHHFKRYLVLAPNGPRGEDVKKFMKRDELALLTSLPGDSSVSRAETVRLKNENLTLRKEIEERWAHAKSEAKPNDKSTTPKDARAEKPADSKKPRGRTYLVQHGDTLASISRKFYKTSGRWQAILDANKDTLPGAEKLKPGQTLVIP